MGSSNSKPAPKYTFINNGEGRLEMRPSDLQFEKRWEVFIQSLDVGPENVRQIEQLDPEQKEQLLLNFESKNPKCSAFHYVTLIQALRTGKSIKKSYNKTEDDPVRVLSATEVSLRTNNVDWVYDFLNNNGLEVLLDYMSKTLVLFLNLNFKNIQTKSTLNLQSDTKSHRSSSDLFRSKSFQCTTTIKRRTSVLSKFQRNKDSVNESVKNSLHQGLKCMRAILNNQRGCEMAFVHSRAIDVIALCLLHPNYQTKTLVLETLAAICLIVNGLQKVLAAFEYFKEITGETRRFDTLITYFRDHETFKVDDYNIDFMVSCTQFINIVVHSGEDINLRVYLQQEFTILGLDEFYKKLEERSGDRLKKQVEAYNGNRVDVAILLEESDAKEALAQDYDKLEQEFYINEEKYQIQIVHMENEKNELLQIVDDLKRQQEEQNNEYRTLKQQLNEPTNFTDREKELMIKIDTLEKVLKDKNIPYDASKLNSESSEIKCPPSAVIPPPPAPLPPPVAPPPPMAPPTCAPPPPGQPPGVIKLGTGASNTQTQSIRPPIQTKFKLPIFNWSVLKNQQLKGTVFVSMNDEVLYDRLEFEKFENIFKLNTVTDSITNGNDFVNNPNDRNSKKKPEKKTLLDASKHRCLGVLLKFLDQEKLSTDMLCKSINQLEVSVEVADRILYQLPTNDDIKLYRKYEYTDKLPVNALTYEDRLLLTLCKIERLQQKLEVVVYIQNFSETYKSLVEKVKIVNRASLAVRSSQKLKQILEIILAYGNLMNSSRRGIMYGFRLQSLDLLTDTKSVDKSWTLMQFFVEVLQSKFPALINFCDEMKFIEQASKIPMEAITTDVNSLVGGMKQVREEMHSNTNQPPRLKRFFEDNEQLTTELSKNALIAKEAFLQAAEWFGERQNNPTPDVFFGIFHRFTENYKKALEEVSKRRTQSLLLNKLPAEETPKAKPKDNVSMEELQKKLAQEARKKNRRVINRTRQINGDGIMDEILAVLDQTPLQAEIHPKRSNPRFQEEVF